MTVSGIGSYAMARHYDVIVVDYLQKVPANGRHLSEFERVSQVSSELQQMGRHTGKVILALSQLSRQEKQVRKGGETVFLPPTLSSLRQSGQIEQDADIVMLLFRRFPNDPKQQQRNLIIPKNKDGVADIGTVLEFDGDNQRFRQSNAQWTPEKKPEAPVQTSIWTSAGRPQGSGGAAQAMFQPLPDGPSPFSQ